MERVYVCDEVVAVQKMHADLISAFLSGGMSIGAFLEGQATRIGEDHASGGSVCMPIIRCWSPKLVCKTESEVRDAEFTIADARETVAREYGFDSAAEVAEIEEARPNLEFEAAVQAVIEGDVLRLKALIDSAPELVHQKSCFGHRATLLHYVAANGVETFRQQTPLNAVEITRFLVDAGSDVNAWANMYGGSQTLGLLFTSAHPAAAGVTYEVADVLLAAGATDPRD